MFSHSLHSSWSPFFKVYDPLKAGSIDGTDTVPHDTAIVRALSANFKPPDSRAATSNPQHTLFVGRLNIKTTQRQLEKEFSQYGDVKSCCVVRDIITGSSRGYGFVEFKWKEDAERAWKKAHSTLLHDRQIIVEWEFARTMPGWIPRRLGGGLGGRKESGQLRFGGRDRPFRKPLIIPTDPDHLKTSAEKVTGDRHEVEDRVVQCWEADDKNSLKNKNSTCYKREKADDGDWSNFENQRRRHSSADVSSKWKQKMNRYEDNYDGSKSKYAGTFYREKSYESHYKSKKRHHYEEESDLFYERPAASRYAHSSKYGASKRHLEEDNDSLYKIENTGSQHRKSSKVVDHQSYYSNVNFDRRTFGLKSKEEKTEDMYSQKHQNYYSNVNFDSRGSSSKSKREIFEENYIKSERHSQTQGHNRGTSDVDADSGYYKSKKIEKSIAEDDSLNHDKTCSKNGRSEKNRKRRYRTDSSESDSCEERKSSKKHKKSDRKSKGKKKKKKSKKHGGELSD